jgi:hypothetical protein
MQAKRMQLRAERAEMQLARSWAWRGLLAMCVLATFAGLIMLCMFLVGRGEIFRVQRDRKSAEISRLQEMLNSGGSMAATTSGANATASSVPPGRLDANPIRSERRPHSDHLCKGGRTMLDR